MLLVFAAFKLFIHLQHHDDVGLCFEGINALDQFWMMKVVHDAYFLSYIFLLLG